MYTPGFTPAHRTAVHDDHIAAAEQREAQAARLDQAGDTAGAEQCRTWAKNCRATAQDIRNNPR
jgi:hypothetical protein